MSAYASYLQGVHPLLFWIKLVSVMLVAGVLAKFGRADVGSGLVLAVVVYYTIVVPLARCCQEHRMPMRIARIYRYRSHTHRGHYVRLQLLGGAGHSSFNWLINAIYSRRLGRTFDTDVDEYGASIRAGYVVNQYDWRDAASIALRMLAYDLLRGRSLTLYLPGHVAPPYKTYERPWRFTFTDNANFA